MDASLINSTTDLVALVPGLRRSGRYFIGPCPFCGGDDRFTIKRADAGDLWLCRKCGDGKYHDAVAFLMRAEGRSFREVTSDERRVTSCEGEQGSRGAEAQGSGGAGAQGSRLPVDRSSFSPAPFLPRSPAPNSSFVTRHSSLATPPDEPWQIARLVDQKRAADQLWDGPDEMTARVYHYLRAERGLTPDTLRRYMLGYHPGEADGLAYPPGIHIPCMVDGQLWYVKARLPKRAQQQARRGRPWPKYVMLPGSRAALFNADALLAARGAVVVEGEFDALLLGQFLPAGWAAVTMGGATTLPGETFLPYFGRLERVLLCLDADDAGRQGLAAWRALLAWAEPAPLPEGVKDVSEFWRRGGDVREWVGRWVETDMV